MSPERGGTNDVEEKRGGHEGGSNPEHCAIR